MHCWLTWLKFYLSDKVKLHLSFAAFFPFTKPISIFNRGVTSTVSMHQEVSAATYLTESMIIGCVRSAAVGKT